MRRRLDYRSEGESSMNPTYVKLNLDKFQDCPNSGQVNLKTGFYRVVILEIYDSKMMLVCLVDTIHRQMILVPESCLEPL